MRQGQFRRLRRLIRRKRVWKNFLRSFLQKIKFSEHIFILLGGLIIGVLGGYGSVGFIYLLRFVEHFFWGVNLTPGEILRNVTWYWFLIVPAVGLILTSLIVKYLAPEARGAGVPEVMEAASIKGGIIRPRVAVFKTLASALSLGTGSSAGREGPMVQIGSAIGSLFGQMTQVSSQRMKTFVGCGAASGIAATFNAPIAGALFAVEIIIGDFGVAHFSPIVVSSVVATVISHTHLGASHVFNLPVYDLVSPWELIPYGMLGLITGAVALGFISLIYRTDDLFEKFRVPFWGKAAAGGVLLGGLGLVFPHVLGNGYPSINLMLLEDLTWGIALVLILWKAVATAVTLGAGGSGGIFAPSLFLGAMTGGVIGTVVHTLMPGLSASPGAYALVGMAGVVGATTHAPLTAILMIFEMTNNYRIILPVMLTTILATLFSMVIRKESIYTLKLLRRGVDIFRGQDINVLRSLNVSSTMRRTVEKVEEVTTLRELMSLMSKSSHSVFFIVDADERLSGYVTLNDLRRMIQETDVLSELIIAGDIAHEESVVLTEEDTLDRAMGLFAQEGIEELPVVENRESRLLVGTIWRQDVIEAYNREIFRRDMASGMASKMVSRQTSPRPVEVVSGFSVLERDVPKFLVGQTIRSIRLRERYHVEVLLIKKPFGGGEKVREIMPSADYRFQDGDVFLLFGESEDVERFSHL